MVSTPPILPVVDLDREELRACGVAATEVARQLALFAHPPGYAQLERACSVGDGIEQITDRPAGFAAHERARRAGRLMKFVPASGAATRMFEALLAVRNDPAGADAAALEARAAAGDAAAREVINVLRELPRFPFHAALCAVAERSGVELPRRGELGDVIAVLDALLGEGGLGYAALPKGLLLFHRDADDACTAFEDQLHEAAEFLADEEGMCRAHFTVSPEHEDPFRALLEEIRPRFAAAGFQLEVSFSTQKASTNTIAVDAENRPFRDRDGRPIFRPGGHGALLENLNDLRGDIVLIQNIDNIRPRAQRGEAVEWKKLLVGHLVRLQEETFALLAALDGGACSAAELAAATALARRMAPVDLSGIEALPLQVQCRRLIAALDRPLRAAAVVRNTGEPGGGPFWVRGRDGRLTRQIIEAAQVDPADAAQREIYDTASHFNPAILACGVRDWRGRPFDLRSFVDPEAVFISRKSKDGRELKALELPGLWNGSMAEWGTVFVEVGDAPFAPVKRLIDLLRPEHLVE